MTCRFQIKVIISKRSGDYHYLIRNNHQNANARARREKPNAAEEKEGKKRWEDGISPVMLAFDRGSLLVVSCQATPCLLGPWNGFSTVEGSTKGRSAFAYCQLVTRLRPRHAV